MMMISLSSLMWVSMLVLMARLTHTHTQVVITLMVILLQREGLVC